MKQNTSHKAVVDYGLLVQYDAVRRQLLDAAAGDAAGAARLERPLAFWALTSDRRLPLVFMDRPLGELLAIDFHELSGTAGVGKKKLATLVTLLKRAADDDMPGEPTSGRTPQEETAPQTAPPGSPGFDPDAVSETSWEKWRATIRRHGLEAEPIGRFATSLQDLPRVLWSAPLESYLEHTLGEIRELKTHGVKRVRTVIEIFGMLDALLGAGPVQPHLCVRIQPQFAEAVQDWLQGRLQQNSVPSEGEVQRRFVQPLLDQARIDVGDSTADLAARRLGLLGEEENVRGIADELGITRARVYQLLADIAVVLQLRWPEGENLAWQLLERYRRRGAHPGAARFETAVELFFPRRREPAPLPEPELQLAGMQRQTW